MKVMVLVKATRHTEAGKRPGAELFRAMTAFNEHLVEAGVMLAGEGLYPTSKGKRVLCSGKERTVLDGPFPEEEGLVSGFWLWQVDSMQDAVDWIRRSPFQHDTIEIRPILETEEFGYASPADMATEDEDLRLAAAAAAP